MDKHIGQTPPNPNNWPGSDQTQSKITEFRSAAQEQAGLSQFKGASKNYLQAVNLQREIGDTENPDFAKDINNLAVLYHIQGQCEEAVPLFEEALEIRKRILGEEHQIVTDTQSNLNLCMQQSRPQTR